MADSQTPSSKPKWVRGAENPDTLKTAELAPTYGKQQRWKKAEELGGQMIKRKPVPMSKDAEVNAEGGSYDNALQAASNRGSEKEVELLLSKGAEVNAQGGLYGNALQAASM